LSKKEAESVRNDMLAGDRSDMPGLVRASFGLYNSLDDVDQLAGALTRISEEKYQGTYIQEVSTGEYKPLGWQPNFEEFLTI
jgi:hypothetical protein